MKNLMDYLVEYGNVDFRQHPFTAVDALVLCQTVYPKLEGIVPEDGFVQWKDIVNHPDRERLYTDRVFGEMYREFMDNVASGSRYAGIEVGRFMEKVCSDREIQFAAATYRMKAEGRDRWFVAFRGTDEKVIGWKEDFNMGHMDVIPSQNMALEYLNSVPGEGPLFVGGHSKGGSQAIYAAAKAVPSVKKRITGIYSFDGMGLGKEFYESEDFRSVSHLVTKIIPDQSIIGTLFEHPKNCLVVKSAGSGFKQHDFMNWLVEDGHFVYRQHLKKRAGRLAGRLKKWIESLDTEEREKFTGLIYRLVLACRPENIYSMGEEKLAKIGIIIDGLKSLEEQERAELKETLKKLIR